MLCGQKNAQLDIEDAKAVPDITLTRALINPLPNMETELPSLAYERVLKQDPIIPKSATESLEPNRAKLLMDKEEAPAPKSRMETAA